MNFYWLKEREKEKGLFSQNTKPNQSKSILFHYELQIESQLSWTLSGTPLKEMEHEAQREE